MMLLLLLVLLVVERHYLLGISQISLLLYFCYCYCKCFCAFVVVVVVVISSSYSKEIFKSAPMVVFSLYVCVCVCVDIVQYYSSDVMFDEPARRARESAYFGGITIGTHQVN